MDPMYVGAMSSEVGGTQLKGFSRFSLRDLRTIKKGLERQMLRPGNAAHARRLRRINIIVNRAIQNKIGAMSSEVGGAPHSRALRDARLAKLKEAYRHEWNRQENWTPRLAKLDKLIARLSRRKVGLAALNSVGMDPSYVGDAADQTVVDELGLEGPENTVGFGIHIHLKPPKFVKDIAHTVDTVRRKAVHTIERFPGVRDAEAAAQKVMQNPIVDTALGNVTIPGNIIMGLAHGGPNGALDAAKKELRNPVRRAAVTALATIFPPAAPAAVALNAANVLLDASESKDPATAAKAVMQLAAIQAGADSGDPHMQEIANVITKAKAARDMIPKGNGIAARMKSAAAVMKSAAARASVSGARSDDAKGAWFKLNVRRDGDSLVATLYSTAGGLFEVSTFSVAIPPLEALAARLHDHLHGQLSKDEQRAVLSGVGTVDGEAVAAENVRRVARSKMADIMRRAGVRVQKPAAPVSDAALATYAVVRRSVESAAHGSPGACLALAKIAARCRAGEPGARKLAAIANAAANAHLAVQDHKAKTGTEPQIAVTPSGAPKFTAPNGAAVGVIREEDDLSFGAEDQTPFELSDDSDAIFSDSVDRQLGFDISGASTKVCCYGA